MRIIAQRWLGLRGCLLAAAGWFLLTVSSHAVVLDWSNVSWTANSLSQSYDVDNTYAGNDISIGVSGDTDRLESGFPVDDNGLTGGFGSGAEALRLRADFNKDYQVLTVTITFNYNTWLADGAQNVSFTIFDIDTDGSYVDQINGISGIDQNGQTVAATLTGGSGVSIANNGAVDATATGTASQGANSSGGNLTIDFGTNVLTSLTFTYANDTTAAKNPNVQNVSMYNISFTKHAIPEVGSSWVALGVCGAVVGLRQLRRRLMKSK
jgi:hypothetical protein